MEIKVIVGPYLHYLGIVGLLYDEFAPTYFILFDEDFYKELTPEEREAMVAHESGHILHKHPHNRSRAALTELQVLADNFGAKFVHPKHLIGVLDKAYADHIIRRHHLEILSQGR
mgnify:CR=1 FL=1